MPDSILIIEDESAIAEGLAYALRQDGFRPRIAADGETGLSAARTDPPDLILLDLMLPGLSGWEVCRAIRKTSSVPIIMVTARAEEMDRVLGLELGADDYVVKPFSTREVVARIRAILRRTAPSESLPEQCLSADGVTMDVSRREVTVDGRSVSFSPKEWDLFEILLRNKGRVLTRDILLERVWGDDSYMDRGTLDVHIRWVRQKIEPDPSAPSRIVTVRGVGYKYAG
ncbi:MAG TPA: response regulator transcription factor [Armatimonadota bacterium]|jgi:two-component system response regulator RegX3